MWTSLIVKKIEINGNQRVSSETVEIFSEVKINSDLSLNNLNNIIKKIYSTNFFSNVSVKLVDNILYISVEENPIIQTLKFEGVKNKYILEVLNEQIEMKEKSSFVENRISPSGTYQSNPPQPNYSQPQQAQQADQTSQQQQQQQQY